MNEQSQIVKQELKQDLATFSDFGNLERMNKLAIEIVKSSFTPYDKPEDVVAALLYGRELGLAPMQSVSNIYLIEGKATAGVHIIAALLSKAGVKREVLADYTPLYQYADGNKEIYGEEEVMMKRDMFQIITPSSPRDEAGKLVYEHGKIAIALMPGENRIGDYKTSIKFTRKMKSGDTEELIVTRKASEYKHLWGKANWKNNPKGMLFNRVLATGGRAIAADHLLGLYLTEEMDEDAPASAMPDNHTMDAEATVVQ